VRIVIPALAALALAAPLTAQDALPDGLAQLEIERSRSCVDILSRLDALDQELGPLAERAQRLMAVGQAIVLEDERVLQQLDTADPVEARVGAWFARDQELAQRYVATLADELNTRRSAAKDSIKASVTEAITAIQSEANGKVEASGNVPAQAGPCDGAIFVRSAVQEACATASGPICDEASLPPSEVKRFRFVDAPEAVWDVTELRPWTNPTPLGVTPDGQLDGARTIGYARTGNVVVSVSFSPLIRDKAEMTPEEAQTYQANNEALGVVFDHPDVTFTTALGLRATLPKPLADESKYVLHFGTPVEADVLWTGLPGSGAALQGTVLLSAAHVQRLQQGDPLTFTALRENEAADNEVVFSIELNNVNQGRATQALLGYMTGQLGTDLTTLLTPRGSAGP